MYDARDAPLQPNGSEPRTRQNRARRIATYAALWLGICLFFYSRDFTWVYFGGVLGPVRWVDLWAAALVSVLLKAVVWTAYTPFIIQLVRRSGSRKESPARSARVHAPTALACAFMGVTLDYLWVRAAYPGPKPDLGPFYLAFLHLDLLFYALTCGAVVAYDRYRSAEGLALQNERLRAHLASAELEAMKLRLDPGLTFQVLDAIRNLLHRDSDAADLLVSSFGELLRQTLKTEGNAVHPVADELDALDLYVEVKQALWLRGLDVEVAAAESVMNCLVPAFLLQYGIESILGDAGSVRQQIRILIVRRDPRLEVRFVMHPARTIAADAELVVSRLERIYAPGTWEIREDRRGEIMISLPCTENEADFAGERWARLPVEPLVVPLR
jgi:hypothetical protein